MKLKQLLLIAVAAISLVSCKEENRDIIIFSAPNLIFPSTGGTKEIGINCKEEWSVTIPEKSWIESVTPMSGKGSAKVTVTAKENTTKESRVTELGFNSQLLAVYQEIGVVEIDLLYGKWETKDGKFKFTFNDDKTCHAEMSMGTFDGTYTIEGNIITIDTGSPKKVTIVVNSIEKEKSMVATMGGTSLYLEYKK